MILEGNTRTNKKNYWKSSSASLVIAILVCFLNNRFSWKRGGAVQITFYKGFDREQKQLQKPNEKKYQAIFRDFSEQLKQSKYRILNKIWKPL